MNHKKKKMILTIALLVSFIPMFFDQIDTNVNNYCANQCINETGLRVLFHPFTLVSIALYFIGVFAKFKNKKNNDRLCIFALCCIIVSEIHNFVNYYGHNIFEYIRGDFRFPWEIAMPMLYVSIIVSIAMLIFYIVFTKIWKEKNKK